MRKLAGRVGRGWVKRVKTHALPLTVGVGLILLRFEPFFFGQSLLFGDNFSLMVPGKLFTAHWLLQGVLPFWNPLLFAGIPWIGDVNQSILYPSTILFMILTPGAALNGTLISHQVLTLIGAYLLCYRFAKQRWGALIGALLWTFSPQMTDSLNNIATLQSLSWTPWVVLAGMGVGRGRRWSLLVVPLLLTIQLLGGYPQHVLYTAMVTVLLNGWVSRGRLASWRGWFSWLATWMGLGVATVLLASFIWMPFLTTLGQSTRSVQSSQQATAGSLHPEDVVKIVFPYLFDQPAAGMKWGPSWNRTPNVFLYVTWFGLLLVGRRLFKKRLDKTEWFFIISSVACILFAFGGLIPGFSYLQQLPLLKQSRGLSIILLIPALVLSIWIGRLVGKTPTSAFSRKLTLTLTVIGIGSLLGWLSYHWWLSSSWHWLNQLVGGRLATSQFHTLARDQVIASLFLQNLAVASLTTAAALFFFKRKQLLLLSLIIGIDLIYFTHAHYRFGPRSVYEFEPQSSDAYGLLQKVDLRQARVLTRNYNAPYSDFSAYNDAFAVRAPFSDSYIDAKELKNFTVLNQMKNGLTPDWNVVANVPVIHGYTTLTPQSIETVFHNQEEDPGINRLSEIKTTHPGLRQWATRYYLVDTWFPDYGEIFPAKLLGQDAQWRLYEIEGALARFRFGSGRAVELLEFHETPNNIWFTFTNPNQETTLVVADRYDRGWRARVNALDVPVANWQGMRQIPIEPGINKVSLRYEPTEYFLGLKLSISTFLLMLAAGGIIWYRSLHPGTHKR